MYNHNWTRIHPPEEKSEGGSMPGWVAEWMVCGWRGGQGSGQVPVWTSTTVTWEPNRGKQVYRHSQTKVATLDREFPATSWARLNLQRSLLENV